VKLAIMEIITLGTDVDFLPLTGYQYPAY